MRSALPRTLLLTAAAALLLPAPGAAAAAPAAGPTVGVQGSAASACVDTALSIRSSTVPTLGTSGSVTVLDDTTGAVADRIDLADPASYRRTVGGAVNADGSPHEFSYAPITLDGDTAAVHLHHQLAYGHRYTVTVDAGVLSTLTAPLSRTFRTRAHAPTGRSLTVSADGRGDFCTVQGAIDAVPTGSSRPYTVEVRPGSYTELDWVPTGKNHLTVQGTGPDPAATTIQYTNNNTLNSAHAVGICPRQLIPGHDDSNCWRASFNVEADDFTLRDLTLHNTTPYGGSQAEAFRGNGDRIALDRVRLLSYQDTLRLQGRGFVTRSYIEGDVDFTWGFGAVLIQDSEIRSLHAGYVTQVRNDAGHPGYVFLRDRLTAAAGVADGSVYLGRIDPTVYPHSQAVFIDTAIGPQIAPTGWLLNNADCTAGADLQFWEYGSTDLTGRPLDTGSRLACSQQLTAAQAALWSDPATVLSGWNPTRHG
ncbi:pectinesterase family protein [Streptacidiphilus carbonis]|uniref:pectinesterase family protein n=1 Tax=Streptacidiphilus carbonis TaxID=105422 RepID=UPI0005A61E28|nr:pectinesterase family protein [Streptacidiphilus carbonis]